MRGYLIRTQPFVEFHCSMLSTLQGEGRKRKKWRDKGRNKKKKIERKASGNQKTHFPIACVSLTGKLSTYHPKWF